ncbi:PREDICTED: uncharacterized protein LOC104591469 isoform X2 [Nelumbo nucifera]|uniref:Uncharacterized protein LOC104591469 isoform X2 n=1 Tax=Nelumbo nucifera TaxID=4432 RepID=A0A1U8Q0C9_NELNU|nr:PREDICTED: uncharacterized protein LOC104591469 isoform X2 [Nelumbo nucifera]
MDFKNQRQQELGTFFVSELNLPRTMNLDITETLSSSFELDTSVISCTEFLGADCGDTLPNKLEVDEEHDSRSKRLKLMAPAKHRVSRYDGEVVAKCYYAKRKLVWEVLDGMLKNKIEVLWSDIVSIKATCNHNMPQTLEIELMNPPLFFRETNPQPRKHTLWKSTGDFTGGQASIFRRHFLQFPQGTLQKHYEKLLQLDDRLFSLSKKPYPSFDSPFFDLDKVQNHHPNDYKSFRLEGQNSNLPTELLGSGNNDGYLEEFHCFTISKTKLPRQDLNLEDRTVASAEIGHDNSCLAHGTSVSIEKAFPTVFASLPSSMPDFGAVSLTKCYKYMNKRTYEGKEILGYNLAMSEIPECKLNSKVKFDSTSDLKPNCWISEIQTNWNPISSWKGVGYKREMDMYFSSGFSYSEQIGSTEILGNCDELLANISCATTFPVFVVEDEEVPKRW